MIVVQAVYALNGGDWDGALMERGSLVVAHNRVGPLRLFYMGPVLHLDGGGGPPSLLQLGSSRKIKVGLHFFGNNHTWARSFLPVAFTAILYV